MQIVFSSLLKGVYSKIKEFAPLEKCLREVYTLSGSVQIVFTSLLKGVYSKRKEFAPLGANSFLLE